MVVGTYSAEPSKHTLQPIVTGATQIGIKYDGGVLLAGDTLCCYGGQKRYKDVCRMKKAGKYTLVGGSGEISDFQYLGDLLDELDDEDFLHEDGCHMGPAEYTSYIGRVMYNRRTKCNPLYNQLIVIGKKNDAPPTLSFIDHQGTAFPEDYIASGFGSYLAMPLLRDEWKTNMSLEDAKKLAVKCLQVCFYRDCRAFNRIQIGTCDKDGVTIGEPFQMEHFWAHGMWTRKTLEDTGGEANADSW